MKAKPGTLGGGTLKQPIILYGVPTKMLDHSSYNFHEGVSCPCGWRDWNCDWTIIGTKEYERILQFHFEHCGAAR